ncbi:flagellar hook-associated protein FlgK [Candidatus Berkiella aquae]|uniref:Flagellar hook-associated protein 1 n=1 Tax=Candidatus Berkiella aquae TaxID=295108 RepID=A0A0Q9YZ82_9GAMM|nr:flagellar hook-associated protein FlgK [Candidatus Berkiella aquae]MCS5711438.1 flagellar hook-associated protein FlgK [Candidatus Berkiella aquae]
MSDMLSIGTTGLGAAQKSLDTISHNISNANTPGYSRQTTLLAARESVQMGQSFTGTGVEVRGTRRIVDQFLTTSLQTQQANFSQYDSFSQVINQLDNIFSDPSTGLSNVLNSFFNAIQDLNANPDSVSARQLLLSQAQVLENRFVDLSERISSQFYNINTQLNGAINQINSLAEQIAQINVKIVNTSNNAFAEAPNDLLDLREELVLELSQYAATSTTIQDNGSMNVFIGNGQAIVMNGTSNRLAAFPNVIDATRTDIAIITATSTEVISSNLKGGQVGGLLSLQDDVLMPSQNALGRIAITLSSSFNAQHQKGVDFEGNLGNKFFNDPNEISSTLNRTLKNRGNTGNAVFSVKINPISIATTTSQTYSVPSNLVDAGTLLPITLGMFSLNDSIIRATVPADDPYSTSDATGSAIAIANAINASSAAHEVTATPEQNVVYLGQFTAGAFAAGEFMINGINIVSAGMNEAMLLQDINALTLQTGVVASGDGTGKIMLVASDGRNIQLSSNGLSTGATFSYFDTQGGVALDKVSRASVLLFSQNNSIKIAGANPAAVGFTAGTVPQAASSLTTDNYNLEYDGTFYTLRNRTYNTVTAQSLIPYFNVDGMTIELQAGAMAVNDSFIIQPTRSGAHDFSVAINNPNFIALGAPVRVNGSLNNRGDVQISLVEITDTSGLPVSVDGVLGNAFSTKGTLSPPIQIEFTSQTSYRVFDVSAGLPGVQIGPDQPYDPSSLNQAVFPIFGVINASLPGPNPTYVYDPGYRVTLQGTPQAGDIFTIQYNNDASGDNRNGLKLANLQSEKTMVNHSATFQDGFAQLVGDIGTKASQAKVNAGSSANLLSFIESRRNEVSGVNLDEEAANLLRFEQAYQAAAQVILVAKSIFDALMDLMR